MDKTEFNEKRRIFMSKLKIFIIQSIKEPYYESIAFLKGHYNSYLLFWLSVGVYTFFKVNNIGGVWIRASLIMGIICLIFFLWNSGKWKQRYKEEFVEGNKDKENK